MNTPPDSTRDALYAAILVHPDEDTPRLAYADYIEEQGDAHRAEFIRAQVRLAAMNKWDDGYTALDVRCGRLLAGHPEWLEPVRELSADLPGPAGSLNEHCGHGPHSVFRRGFPAVGASRAEWFAGSHEKLFAAFPFEAMGFVMDYAGARGALADCPGLARLRGVGISMWGEEEEGFEAIAKFRHVGRLERLEMYSECVSAAPLESLLLAAQFSGLRSFALCRDCSDYDPRQPRDVVRELPPTAWLFGVRELAVDGDVFEGLGQALARGTGWVPRLKRLALRGYMGHYGDITGETVARVGQGLRSGWFAAVEDLDLMSCDFEGLVIDSLAASGAASPLRLTLPRRNRNGYQKGLEAKPGVLRSGWLGGLRELRLLAPGEAEMGELLDSDLPGSLRALSLSAGRSGVPLHALLDVPGGWPELERLHLINTCCPPDVFAALLDSRRFPKLVSITIYEKEPASDFLKELSKFSAPGALRELDLQAPLDEAGAAALQASPHLEDIDLLTVIEGTASRAACDRLKQRFGSRVVIQANKAGAMGDE